MITKETYPVGVNNIMGRPKTIFFIAFENLDVDVDHGPVGPVLILLDRDLGPVSVHVPHDVVSVHVFCEF